MRVFMSCERRVPRHRSGLKRMARPPPLAARRHDRLPQPVDEHRRVARIRGLLGGTRRPALAWGTRARHFPIAWRRVAQLVVTFLLIVGLKLMCARLSEREFEDVQKIFRGGPRAVI